MLVVIPRSGDCYNVTRAQLRELLDLKLKEGYKHY